VRIPKGSYDDGSIAPAWLPIQDREGNQLKPIIRCQCGSLMGIGLHHVHADGRVTASFYHWWPPDSEMGKALQGCGFHEYLELDGYDGPEFPPTPK